MIYDMNWATQRRVTNLVSDRLCERTRSITTESDNKEPCAFVSQYSGKIEH